MALNFYQYTKSADKYGPIATPEPVKASEPGLLSNMGRSAASGALSGVGGIFDFVGADGIAKQFYGWSDDARQSMSAEAQADMAKPFFTENDQGEIQLGEGLTDLDTWLLTMANVAGQFAPTAIPGAGLANTATKALKLGETGAKVATAVGMGATGGASATGQGMEQARQEWKQMPDELKLQSDLFKNTIREMKQQRPELDGEALWIAAEDNVAERLASEVQTDPKVLLANFAGSAIADPIIGRALTGARLAKSGAFRSASKGFAVEGSTEAGQAAVQEYGINQALSQVDGRDPMDGVAVAALNEGVAGGMLGAAAGGVGGVLNRKQAAPVRDPDADAIRDSNPALAAAIDGVAQSSADRQADLDAVIGGMPAISQLPLEGELLGPEPAPSEPLMITDKNIIFAGDGRPQQAQQEYVDNLQRQANQAASVPRLPQKDIIFAGDQSGVRVKGNGEVYKSPREAMTSKQARAMKRSGTPVEAVQFGDGWGWRVKEGDSLLQTSTAPGATSEDGGPQTSETLGLNLQQTAPMLAGEVDQINQPQPVQFKKSGDPFKSEKEMKISASYKAAAATGAELETVPVDGGFGFRVKAAPMEVKVAPGGLSEGHDSTQPTSSEPTPTRLGDGAEAPNTVIEPAGAAQTENSNVSLAAPVGASQPESIDTELGTSADVTLPTVEAGASVIDSEPTGNAATELPAILRTTKKKFIAQQVKQQKLKESSPGYAQAVARLEEQYETDIDRAQAGLTFEQFNALNDDSPEAVNRQAYKALREEFGLPVDIQFSKRRIDEAAAPTQPSVNGIAESDGSTQLDEPDSKKPEQVRLIGSQSPLSGSPSQVSSENVQSDAETGNPDIVFGKQNTIKAKPAKGVNSRLAKQFVNGIMQRLNGAAGTKVVVLESQSEAEKLWQMSLAGDLVRGAYNRATNTAYVIAENIKSMDELREVVAHEVIGHGGLQNVISKADYKTFIERLKQTRNNRSFAQQWAEIDNDYEGFSENDKAEELFAYFVQNKPVTGPVKFWWNALKRWLHKALVSVGLAKAGDPDVEAMQDMLESIQQGFAAGRSADSPGGDSQLSFSKTKTAEAVAGAVSDLVGRKRLDPDDPYAVENRRLKEQDRTLWEKAKQVFMRNFAPGGMLPRSIFDAKITRDGELESGEMTIKHLIFALERAVQKDTGKNVDNQSEEFINMMADALAGKVNDKLGNETKAALVAMRQYIDALSGDYLSVIQAKIDKLTEQIKQDDKYTDKVKALNEIELYEKIKGNMGVYVNRSYRAFDDPKWFQKVPVDVINRAREYLIRQYKAGGDTDADARVNAEVTLESILKEDTAYSSMESFIAESKLGAKDLSTLIARKDISPEIRELLGEYKDPRMNFAKTATKMSRLVWNSRFLSKIKADGMGVFFFEKDDRPPGANTPIAGENSKTYEPLNGLYTFPEVAQALQDSLGAEKMEDWYEAAVKLTSMVKYGKTVLSPTTAMRNWQSAMFFAVANGHFDFKHMKKSLAAFREQVSQSATGDDLAYLKKLKKLGVVYDAPYAGEMMQLLSDSKIDEWLEGRKGKVFGTVRQINNLAQGFYSFGDDFWKIIGFENEKANFISAGLSEAEAEKMAAERIRNTYPTYSMVGRAIKKLARFPLMGTFVSFPAEIIRTTANMLRYAAQDMKSDNPKIRAMARKRLTGMALVSGMFYALSAMTAAMQGVDDEEEEAIRDVGPSWQKNSTFLFYGRDDKGKLQYFDISFLDPYGYFKRPITALMRDQPWEDAAASGAADMLSPFFGADITAGTFFQVFANKKQSGGQVYNEYADGTDQLVSIADHIWTGLRPGFVNNAMGIFNAAAGNRREGSGKEYDLGDEMMALMGWRASSLDAPTALYYRSFDFADQLQAANSTLNKVLRSDNSVDDDDIADAKEEAQRQYDDAFKQMQRIVQSGRNAGMTKEQVYRTLKLSGVSSRNISGLVNGNIPPMQAATLQTQVKAVAKAREIRGDEQASEVLRRFQIARQLQ